MASNVASSAINSFSLRGLVTGGDAFDEDAFGRGAFGRDAMAGVAAGMAGNAVTVGMRTTVGSMDFKKFNVSTGDIDFNQINKLGALAGSAASAMVQYGMTGETTVNVLNAHTLAGLFGVDLKNKDGDAVTTGLFGLTFGNDGVHGSITTSGYAMDVADIMVGLQAFDDISAKNDLQRDVNNAARERDRIKNITDRVIAIGEVSYEGNTDQAASLLAQLQGVRSLQSKDNLHSMFQNKAENGYSESRLDENLDLAFKQHDISVHEFMNSAEFDTTGSFKHAMTFYNRSFGASKAGSAAIKQLGYNVTLEDMFSTGKAYAGNEYAESDTLKSRVGLFEAGLKAELGAKVYSDAEKIGGGDIFKGSTHIERRILENGDQLRMAYETSGKDIALVEKTYQSMVKVDDIAVNLDNGGTDYNVMQFLDAKNKYIKNLNELIKTDIFDGLAFDVQKGLNGAPMRNAKLTGRYENRLILPGMSMYPENYYKWSVHTGIDVSSTSYDPTFYSSFGGTLDITGWDHDSKGFGISLRRNGANGLDYFHSAKGSLDIFTKAYLTGKGKVPGGVAIGTTGTDFYGIGDGAHLHIEGVTGGERVSPLDYIPETSFVDETLYSQQLSGFPRENPPSYTDTNILQGVLNTGLSNFQNYTQLHLGQQCNSMEDVYYWFYLQAAHNHQQEE